MGYMEKEFIMVGFPNEGDMSINVEILKRWTVSGITPVGDKVYFDYEDTQLSMDEQDFHEIFFE